MFTYNIKVSHHLSGRKYSIYCFCGLQKKALSFLGMLGLCLEVGMFVIGLRVAPIGNRSMVQVHLSQKCLV